MRQIRTSGSMSGRWRRSTATLVRHRQPKGSATRLASPKPPRHLSTLPHFSRQTFTTRSGLVLRLLDARPDLSRHLIQRHAVLLEQRHIALETAIAPDAEMVDGDARRLEQVLQNLVANAARHTPEGGRIMLSAAGQDGAIRIRMEDSGSGIPAAHLPLVFDRFYKVDAARGPGGGSGLGLSIVKAIVEAHGGTVTASSPPGGGAQFDVILPRHSHM